MALRFQLLKCDEQYQYFTKIKINDHLFQTGDFVLVRTPDTQLAGRIQHFSRLDNFKITFLPLIPPRDLPPNLRQGYHAECEYVAVLPFQDLDAAAVREIERIPVLLYDHYIICPDKDSFFIREYFDGDKRTLVSSLDDLPWTEHARVVRTRTCPVLRRPVLPVVPPERRMVSVPPFKPSPVLPRKSPNSTRRKSPDSARHKSPDSGLRPLKFDSGVPQSPSGALPKPPKRVSVTSRSAPTTPTKSRLTGFNFEVVRTFPPPEHFMHYLTYYQRNLLVALGYAPPEAFLGSISHDNPLLDPGIKRISRELVDMKQSLISNMWNHPLTSEIMNHSKMRMFNTTRIGNKCAMCQKASHRDRVRVVLYGKYYDSGMLHTGEYTPLIPFLSGQALDDQEHNVDLEMGNHCYERSLLFHQLHHFPFVVLTELYNLATCAKAKWVKDNGPLTSPFQIPIDYYEVDLPFLLQKYMALYEQMSSAVNKILRFRFH